MTDLIQEIKRELSRLYDFEEKGKYLHGRCSFCGHKEAWTWADNPGVIFCNRGNECGEKISTRSLFPDLHENFSDRYPSTESRPNATAEAYLTMNRGFDLNKINPQLWTQGAKKIPSGGYAETVRFPLWDNHYWERIIDVRKAAMLPNARKAHFSYKIQNTDKHWAPRKHKLKKGDRLFIVEGIFHAIALDHVNKKAVAAFTTNILPRELIKANQGKGVIWCLAYDNGIAGRKWALKYRDELEAMGEKVEIHLCESDEVDWDEALRRGLLTNDDFWKKCAHRGKLLAAKDEYEYAFHRYIKRSYNYTVIAYKNALYKVNNHKIKDANDIKGLADFRSKTEIEKISNVYPEFLYREVDELMGDKFYTFQINYASGHKKEFFTVDGGRIDKPNSFNTSLFKETAGGHFSGSDTDLKILHSRWFDKHIRTVESIPFIGYEKNTGAYIFPTLAVNNGRRININKHNYFQIGRDSLKSTLKSIKFNHGDFTPIVFELIYKAWGNNGLVSLAAWIQSLFAEQIRTEFKSLPFYELTGEPGAGKSTLIRNLWRLLGREGWEGLDPNKARPAGRRRHMAQVSNMPIVFIESDRDDDKEGNKPKIKSFDWDELKPLYDHGGILGTLGVAKRGHDTEDPVFLAALFISQNAEINASKAIIERIVHIHFKTAQRETVQYVKQLDKLTTKDISGLMLHVLKHEEQYLERYKDAVERYSQIMYQIGIKIAEVRLVLNHAQTMAAVECLQLFFPKLDASVLASAQAFVCDRLKKREERLTGDSQTLRDFWSTFDYIDQRNQAEKNSASSLYEAKPILNHSKNPDIEIALNINHFIQKCRDYNQPLQDMVDVKKQLPQSKTHAFKEAKKGRSAIDGSTMHLWYFTRGKEQ